jgi:hypothetical protein
MADPWLSNRSWRFLAAAYAFSGRLCGPFCIWAWDVGVGSVTMSIPLIAYQQALANSLFERMFLIMVPTWCQAGSA